MDDRRQFRDLLPRRPGTAARGTHSTDMAMIRAALRCLSTTRKSQVKLFTPGPLNTTRSVKEAMLYDFGSRDPDFGRIVEDIKLRLLKTAKVNPRDFASIIVQGSGTFAVEATLGTAFPQRSDYDRSLLICANGAYGERMVKICQILGINHTVLRYADYEIVQTADVKQALRENPGVSHFAMVHSETTSGLLNPCADIADAVHQVNPSISVVVDMMSSFGAVHLDMIDHNIDYLVSSSNKMLQGVPGFAFVIARLSKLRQCKGNSRSLGLDLYEQWDYQLSNPGQFRFTPPTHVISAFYEALLEHEQEGGVKARGERYYNNQRILSTEMQKLGFKLYVDPKHQGCVITTFLEPKHPKFNFKAMYDYLATRGIVIYPGKLSKAPSFRLGSIGDLHAEDMIHCIENIKDAFKFMGVPLPLKEESETS